MGVTCCEINRIVKTTSRELCNVQSHQKNWCVRQRIIETRQMTQVIQKLIIISDNKITFFTHFDQIDLHLGKKAALQFTILQKLLQEIIIWVKRK